MIIFDKYYLTLTLLVTIVMQLLFFAIAFTFKFDKVTDFAGCCNFLILAVMVFIMRSTFYTRQKILTLFTVLWALRLGSYLLIRVIIRGKDDRFDEMRDNFWSFLGFWVFQMVWVFIVSLPVTLNNAALNDSPLNWSDYIGWTFWLIGVFVESVSDLQKFSYALTAKELRTPFMSSGFWSFSRHPNYFGEILLWTGIFLSSTNAYRVAANQIRFGFVSVVSPLFTFVLLLFVSGIPIAEKNSDKKYGNLTEYIDYKRSTSPLILFPPQIYRQLPQIIKLIFLFEFSFYNNLNTTQY